MLLETGILKEPKLEGKTISTSYIFSATTSETSAISDSSFTSVAGCVSTKTSFFICYI